MYNKPTNQPVSQLPTGSRPFVRQIRERERIGSDLNAYSLRATRVDARLTNCPTAPPIRRDCCRDSQKGRQGGGMGVGGTVRREEEGWCVSSRYIHAIHRHIATSLTARSSYLLTCTWSSAGPSGWDTAMRCDDVPPPPPPNPHITNGQLACSRYSRPLLSGSQRTVNYGAKAFDEPIVR